MKNNTCIDVRPSTIGPRIRQISLRLIRATVFAVLFVLATLCLHGGPGNSGLNAQDPDPGLTDSADLDATTDDASNLENTTPSIFQMMFAGNAFGIVIVGLILLSSIISTFFIIEHALSLTRSKLIPDKALKELERLISRGEINEAIQLCHQKENYSLSTDVILAGLERYNASEFGFAEYRTAVEEAGEDHTGKLYRKTEVLNVIAAIAPMLGLTGTVIGMIEAFNTIAIKDGAARPGELAGGIGQALITTLLGLVVAIPTMVAVSFFRNKIDSIVAEAGKRVERILLPLGRKK